MPDYHVWMHTLKFSYPRRGLTGRFNTFRLGQSCAGFSQGEPVQLVDSRSGKLLGLATVERVHVGPLDLMAVEHAHSAHNWRDHPLDQRPELLKASMKKRYPPNRVREDSVVTVIYLTEQPHKESPDVHLPEPRLGR